MRVDRCVSYRCAPLRRSLRQSLRLRLLLRVSLLACTLLQVLKVQMRASARVRRVLLAVGNLFVARGTTARSLVPSEPALTRLRFALLLNASA